MPNANKTRDKSEIRRILHDAFGWALTKDRALFESIFAKDEDFFTYYPDSKSTVRGWSQFEEFLDRWIDPRNVAKGFEIRDLRIVVSRKGDTAWFSAIADDEGEFDGKPWARRMFGGQVFSSDGAEAGEYASSTCQTLMIRGHNSGRRETPQMKTSGL